MYKFKKDSYQRARGGNSRVLDVSCKHCGNHVAYYQKDGPGLLKRMYQDRFIDSSPQDEALTCESCKRVLGIKYIFKKENRPAYRLFVGAVDKKVTAQDKLT